MATQYKKVTIASGATSSTVIDLRSGEYGNMCIAAVICPGTIDAVTLAVHTSADSSTFSPVYGADGVAKTITQVAGAHMALNPADYASVGGRAVKLVASGAVAADRIYEVAIRDA